MVLIRSISLRNFHGSRLAVQCISYMLVGMSRLSVYRKYRGTDLYRLFVPWACDSYRDTVTPPPRVSCRISPGGGGVGGLWGGGGVA